MKWIITEKRLIINRALESISTVITHKNAAEAGFYWLWLEKLHFHEVSSTPPKDIALACAAIDFIRCVRRRLSRRAILVRHVIENRW
jgi:hypothetical protein